MTGHEQSIQDVLHFYFERDIHPEKWYPRRNGKLVVYDDLPPEYRDNVDHLDPPFLGQKLGKKPALSEADVQDLLAFLKTLNDGYSATAGGPKAGGAN